MATDIRLYAVCNARYFPSLVALINSLHLTGHRHELIVGDCGLTPDQRERLAPHCTIFPIPADRARDPVLLKPFPHLMAPSGIVVIIDSDFIVTGSLEAIFMQAESGRICAYPDPSVDRHFPEWESLFNLPVPPRNQPYLSAGFVAFSAERWPNLLAQYWKACERIPSQRTLANGAAFDEPLAAGDQDALNAVLMSLVPAEAIEVLPGDERPVWHNDSVRVIDEDRLVCSYLGTPTKLLHADGAQKPWERRAWWRIEEDAYVLLLRRLILGDDLVLRVHPNEVPIWLRDGISGRLALKALHAVRHLGIAITRHSPARGLERWLLDRLARRRGPSSAG